MRINVKNPNRFEGTDYAAGDQTVTDALGVRMVKAGVATNLDAKIETFSRTLTLADNQKILNAAHATVPIVFTIDKDEVTGWGDGSQVAFYWAGVAAVSFAFASGVTPDNTAPSSAKGSTVGVMWVSPNVWAYIKG